MSSTIFPRYAFSGDFIGGNFRLSKDPDHSFEVRSPANLQDFLGEVHCDYSSVDESIAAAQRARDSWLLQSFDARKAVLDRCLEVLRDRAPQIRQVIARETGKPLWEISDEIGSVEQRYNCLIQELRAANLFTEGALLNGVGGKAEKMHLRAKPRGITLVISHFNLPLDSALSFIFPALLAGNVVILKPSKRTPALGQEIASIFQQANAPAGIFNLVQGGREMARRLAQQSEVDTVFYAGDYEFGKLLRKDTAEHSEKLLILETGGKNPAIILDDADLDLAITETLIAAYQTAGQRAESLSRILLGEKIAEEFIERFHEAAKKIVIGNPFDEANPPFMGPLIDKKSLARYLTFQGMAVREGGECIMRGKTIGADSDGFYVSPSIYFFKETDLAKTVASTFLQTEIFGPSLGIQVVNSVDQAVAFANASNYGLLCSVFTRSEENYRRSWEGLRYGAIHWNQGTTRRSYGQPLSGIRRSFKANPMVQSMFGYVSYPVHSVEEAEPIRRTSLPPGIDLTKN